MKNFCIALTTLIFILALQTTALAAPDSYIGDAAIYTALDTGTDRPKPHVLLLIDTSKSTLNRASGIKYVFNAATPYTGANRPWNVYAANNQGNFSTLEVASSTAALEGITCSTAGGTLIKTTLLASGTYSGSGSAASPNLRGGTCDIAPMGATYALGNYLNYLEANAADSGDTVVQTTYDCEISQYRNATSFKNPEWVVNGCTGTFKFSGTAAHVSTAYTKPRNSLPVVVGEPGWTSYWTQVSRGCIAGIVGTTGRINCAANSSPPTLTIPAGTPPAWSLGASFSPSTTFVGGTQREIIYNALAQVVDGARGAVKFGAMTYNPNNQGGYVVYPMSDLTNEATFTAFKAALPGQTSTGTLTGAALITSQTNRPQAEALFDAGYYLGARYPTTGTIASTAVFPLPNITARENVNTADMAGKYLASNRNECGYNHIILITNGLSNGDNSPKLAPIVDADGDARTNELVYGGGSHYLDDVAAYLFKQEGVITHTVLAFQTTDPMIKGAALSGGGQFYNVYDANSLAEALTKLLASIVLEADTSFVAPVVPASSTNRTISSNRVYLGLFKPQNNRPWLGNLKKYGVSSSLTLLDRSGAATTDANGDFLPNSKSFWGDKEVDGVKKIMSIDGLLPLAVGSVAGDGGNVAAGGVGGTLIVDLQAGVLSSQQAWQTRKIYTWVSGSLPQTLTATAQRFSPDNTTNITATTLAVADDTEKNKLINFVAGADGYDDNNNGNSTEIRDWVLGDILHSKPLIYSYSSYAEADEGNCARNTSMIYVGSNDGMFHAFRDCDGKEVWAFIPDNVLPNLKYLREREHYYFSDATPTAYVHDVNNNNIIETADLDKVVLIFGQGRGGGRSTLDATGSRGAYYALDVSDPLVPVLLWKVDSNTSDFGELGETLSSPRLARVKVGTVEKVVAFVGAGYDNNEDLRFGNTMLFPAATTPTTNTTLPTSNSGNLTSLNSTAAPVNPRGRGIFAIQIANLVKANAAAASATNPFLPVFTGGGSLVWSLVHTDSNGMNYSFPSDLTVLDMNGDGFQDRIYVGDTGGQLWRFDVSSTVTSEWTGRMIFKSNKAGEANTGRKIFYKPTVALVQGVPTLYFGTGDRNHPLNTAVIDRMFAVKDRGQSTATAIGIDNLENLTLNDLQGTNVNLVAPILDDLALATNYGWYVDLNLHAGEKVLAPTLIFSKQAFYTTYAPSANASLNTCEVGNLGKSRLYQLDYENAQATQNFYGGNDGSTTYANNLRARGGAADSYYGLQREDREKEIGVGIPSGIVTLIDASGKVTLMISSSNRVGTYQAPSAKMMSPLYWIQY